jgi:hypothetical protein
MLSLKKICQIKFTHYVLVAHMYKHIGALHVSGVEFFILFEISRGRDADMIN